MSTYRLNPPQQIGPDRRAQAAVSVPVAVPSTPALSAALKEEINNPMRRMGMVLSLVFIFLRFSQLHELMTYMFGFNTYILYFCGPPAIALAIFSGGLRRVFSSRIAWMWAGFVLWMLLSTPFSFWRGESIALFGKYMRTEFPCLLLIAGLCVTWQDIR